MQFNEHSNLIGQHAFLSASKYHWIGYDDERLTASTLLLLQLVEGPSFMCLPMRLFG